jgi:hypothetical protein
MSSDKVMIRMGKPEKLGRKLTQATSSNTLFTNHPQFNQWFRDENPARNDLIYGTMNFDNVEMK